MLRAQPPIRRPTLPGAAHMRFLRPERRVVAAPRRGGAHAAFLPPQVERGPSLVAPPPCHCSVGVHSHRRRSGPGLAGESSGSATAASGGGSAAQALGGAATATGGVQRAAHLG